MMKLINHTKTTKYLHQEHMIQKKKKYMKIEILQKTSLASIKEEIEMSKKSQQSCQPIIIQFWYIRTYPQFIIMPYRFAYHVGYILIWWWEKALIICVLASTFRCKTATTTTAAAAIIISKYYDFEVQHKIQNTHPYYQWWPYLLSPRSQICHSWTFRPICDEIPRLRKKIAS